MAQIINLPDGEQGEETKEFLVNLLNSKLFTGIKNNWVNVSRDQLQLDLDAVVQTDCEITWLRNPYEQREQRWTIPKGTNIRTIFYHYNSLCLIDDGYELGININELLEWSNRAEEIGEQ